MTAKGTLRTKSSMPILSSLDLKLKQQQCCNLSVERTFHFQDVWFDATSRYPKEVNMADRILTLPGEKVKKKRCIVCFVKSFLFSFSFLCFIHVKSVYTFLKSDCCKTVDLMNIHGPYSRPQNFSLPTKGKKNYYSLNCSKSQLPLEKYFVPWKLFPPSLQYLVQTQARYKHQIRICNFR